MGWDFFFVYSHHFSPPSALSSHLAYIFSSPNTNVLHQSAQRTFMYFFTFTICSQDKPLQIFISQVKFSPGGPSPHNLARALMPRQPYSVAVPSTE